MILPRFLYFPSSFTGSLYIQQVLDFPLPSAWAVQSLKAPICFAKRGVENNIKPAARAVNKRVIVFLPIFRPDA